MQAILLVGGFGTRLRPLTLTTPKQMLPLLHRPMIEHVVSALASHGVDRVVLALGYHDDAFRSAYPDSKCAGVELCCVVEPEPLDTAGAIRFAFEASDSDASAGTFLVANGDVITDLDVSAMLHHHRSVAAQATIHLIEVNDPSQYGVVITEPSSRVTDFLEKPPPPAVSNWINAGTYLMEPSAVELIADGRRVSVEREVFPAMAAAGNLWAFKHNTYWLDAGTPQTYLQAQLDLLDGHRGPAEVGLSPEASLESGASVDRSVVMSGAVIGRGATVKGSVVGARAVIEPAALVLDSVVGARATIGQGAQVIAGTLVGEGFVVAPEAVLKGARAPLVSTTEQ